MDLLRRHQGRRGITQPWIQSRLNSGSSDALDVVDDPPTTATPVGRTGLELSQPDRFGKQRRTSTIEHGQLKHRPVFTIEWANMSTFSARPVDLLRAVASTASHASR